MTRFQRTGSLQHGRIELDCSVGRGCCCVCNASEQPLTFRDNRGQRILVRRQRGSSTLDSVQELILRRLKGVVIPSRVESSRVESSRVEKLARIQLVMAPG